MVKGEDIDKGEGWNSQMGKELVQTFGVHESFDEGSEEPNNLHLDPMAFQGRGPSEYGLWKA